MEYFAKNMSFLRALKGKTQDEMSHQFGFSRTAWNNYETARSKPGLNDLVKISKYFGVPESHLLHTNLEARGNLIFTDIDIENAKMGNLKGNVKGNLMAKKYPKNKILTIAKETDEAKVLSIKMPKVITVDSQGNENVMLVPVKARAGYLSGYADPEFIATLPTYRLPGLNNGTFRMFEVSGRSMADTLFDHDILICSFVEQWRNVRDDRIHVFVTKSDGIVVKRVLNRFDKDHKFILNSDNYREREEYPPIICEPDDVLEIWYGVARFTRQMRPPAEMYKRLVDLEGRFTILEDSVKKKKK